MIKISAIILAYNSESDIIDCLDSVSFCDERIVVLDSRSNDRTEDLAKRAGARVIKANSSDFSEKRNMGLHATKGEWVLYIDTDERVMPSLREEICKYANMQICKYSAFMVKRKNFYLGRHEWPTIERLERLFYREKLKRWEGELHESPIIEGEIGELNGFLEHYTHKDLRSMLDKTIQWSEVEAKLRLDAHHPKMTWWRFPRVMMPVFVNYYFKQGGWKIGTAGLIESTYQAFSIFITYAKLWEMQSKIKNQNAKVKSTS
jgi:glycosyltransferase involved in cell wall biosynthesis